MKGCFITFEGTEGSGKTTQIKSLTDRIVSLGRTVRSVREPGGTPIGEELRHTLKHSQQNHAMTPEAELLLMSASRAQLVREVIRPALASCEVVICDRFYDSTIAYQGYGRQLDLGFVRAVTDFAIAGMRPDLTFFLHLPVAISESRRRTRFIGEMPARDRLEEADRGFFERVERGYLAIAGAEPDRVCWIDATEGISDVFTAIWRRAEPLVAQGGAARTSR